MKVYRYPRDRRVLEKLFSAGEELRDEQILRTVQDIIANVRTDLMAAQVGSSHRGTVLFSMTVPKAVGMTGTFVAIDAIQ